MPPPPTGNPDAGLTIVYDGECPFCTRYVKLMRLRRAVGPVRLVNARDDDPLVRELWRDGYDLDEGMMAIYGGTRYYGADCLVLLSALSSGSNLFSRACAVVFRYPRIAGALYPVLKFGRSVTLAALGRSRLNRKALGR